MIPQDEFEPLTETSHHGRDPAYTDGGWIGLAIIMGVFFGALYALIAALFL